MNITGSMVDTIIVNNNQPPVRIIKCIHKFYMLQIEMVSKTWYNLQIRPLHTSSRTKDGKLPNPHHILICLILWAYWNVFNLFVLYSLVSLNNLLFQCIFLLPCDASRLFLIRDTWTHFFGNYPHDRTSRTKPKPASL